MGTNAIVGGGVPLAAGMAWARQRQGKGDVVFTYFGDGAVNIGAVPESMNLASLWQLPICFFIENNCYAVATTLAESTHDPRLSSRGPGDGIPSFRVDGMDPIAVRIATQMALECRMVAQAWGHNPGQKVLGAPQLYLFEPHQTEQMGWKPDVFLDISEVWDKKRAAIECMEGQQHLWHYYTNVAENRANHFQRNSGGQSGGRPATHAEGFQSVFPRTVDEL